MKRNTSIKPLFLACFAGVVVFLFYFLFFDFFPNLIISKFTARNDSNFITILENKSFDFMLFLKTKFFTSKNQKSSNSVIIASAEEKKRLSVSQMIAISDKFPSVGHKGNPLFFDHSLAVYDSKNNTSFIGALNNNGHVFFDYYLDNDQDESCLPEDFVYNADKYGIVDNVSGTVSKAHTFFCSNLTNILYLDYLKGMGAGNIFKDADGIVRRYPLVYRYILKRNKEFIELKSGEYLDALSLECYKISYSSEDNLYFLEKKEKELFSQFDLLSSKRDVLSENRLDLVKADIEKEQNYFQIELEALEGKINKNRRKIVSQILFHLDNSSIPKDIKHSIISILSADKIQKDLDETLYNFVTAFKEFAKVDEVWQEEVDFFYGLYKRCIKVNKDSLISNFRIDNEDVTLYDLLYNNKNAIFEKLILMQEYFVLSMPLVLIAEYYNIARSDIEVVFGNKILLKNPKVFDYKSRNYQKLIVDGKKCDEICIPINEDGSLFINFLNKQEVFFVLSEREFNNYGALKNKIVLADDFSLLYPTPLNDFSKAEVMSAVINCVTNRDYIRLLPNYIYLLILFLISIIISIIGLLKKDIKIFGFIFLFLIFYVFLALFVFFYFNIVLEIFKIFIIGFLHLILVLFYRNRRMV